MIFELIIVLELIAFVFLALGILPYKGDALTGKVPLLNKMIFVLTAMIIFFMLGLNAAVYDYNYCYVNQTTSDFTLNQSTSTATCDNYEITDVGFAYLNLFLGFFCIVMMIVIALFALSSRHENDPGMGDYDA